jgi:hypothetical protein
MLALVLLWAALAELQPAEGIELAGEAVLTRLTQVVILNGGDEHKVDIHHRHLLKQIAMYRNISSFNMITMFKFQYKG